MKVILAVLAHGLIPRIEGASDWLEATLEPGHGTTADQASPK